jgi:hypothetical protein
LLFHFALLRSQSALSRAVNSRVTRGTQEFKVRQKLKVSGSIHRISVDNRPTFLAYKNPISKLHIRMIPATARARLTRWFPPGDGMDLYTSLLSLKGQVPTELRKTHISNGAGLLTVLEHPSARHLRARLCQFAFAVLRFAEPFWV